MQPTGTMGNRREVWVNAQVYEDAEVQAAPIPEPPSPPVRRAAQVIAFALGLPLWSDERMTGNKARFEQGTAISPRYGRALSIEQSPRRDRNVTLAPSYAEQIGPEE